MEHCQLMLLIRVFILGFKDRLNKGRPKAQERAKEVNHFVSPGWWDLLKYCVFVMMMLVKLLIELTIGVYDG